MRSAPTRRARVYASASDFFSNDLRQDVLIEREIRHQALQLRVLFAQLPEFPDLATA